MSRDYNRVALQQRGDAVAAWDDYLRHNSRLPGVRPNFDLLQVAVEEGDERRFRHWCEEGRDAHDSPDEFLALCGVAGLGRLAAEAFDTSRRVPDALKRELRRYANDPRPRVGQAVALGLHRIGAMHLRPLLDLAGSWSTGTRREQRVAVLGLGDAGLVAGAKPREREQMLAVYTRVAGGLGPAHDGESLDDRSLRRVLAQLELLLRPDSRE